MIFMGCQSNRNQTAGTDSGSTMADTPEVIDRSLKVFKGFYSTGPDATEFQECDNQKTYWVNDSTADLKTKYREAIQPLPYPNQSVYAEVKGYLSGKPAGGASAGYENALVITEIIKLEAKNFRTACYDYEFIALGNEPFWGLDIVPASQQIILKDLSVDKVFVFPYQPANIGGGVHRFETLNAAKDKLTVIIREEECSDGMSDNTYNYSAEIVINGRTLKGCAVKKGDLD